ncbi:phenylacetic acid degradation operon negative regulatory protein [Leifsonia naganoensis]|uniref:Phenylacetic acid degradation operon negative regulatory protein n=2 Tax=Leifsonia naganoensis TaxID=150025 RepID=A0A853DST4_9MICO|nr:phenylacetic acid degradation operon negative regulatory protein [Leifsonia naganoensis]
MTVLGEVWRCDEGVLVPSAAIVDIVSRLGFSEVSVRGALSRMQRKGTLVLHKVGRTTAYRLSEDVLESIPASEVLTMGFGVSTRPWDGTWTVVVYSLTDAQRDRRQTLREWLRWLGFGPVRDGVWISPDADADVTRKALSDLLPPDGLVLRSSIIAGEVMPDRVWSLDRVRDAYVSFIEEFRPSLFSLREGTVSPAEAFVLWNSILGRWRAFPSTDPDLPNTALPVDWPRLEARRIFVTVHDECVPLVENLIRGIVEPYSAELASHVRLLTVEESLAVHSELSARSDRPRALEAIDPALLPSA